MNHVVFTNFELVVEQLEVSFKKVDLLRKKSVRNV